jgi:hypothetical protein
MTWRRLARARAGWAVAAIVAVATLTAAQAPSPPPSSGQIAGGQITGTVRSAADGSPIGRARVVAQSANGDPHVTLTGADGRYVLSGLPVGSYRISVTRTGYVSKRYGEERNTQPAQVNMSPTWRVTDIDVALEPGRHIAGRILDEDGTPFAGAVVEALIARVDRGRDTLTGVASSATDDRGEFRLHGLAPGEYFVSAADPAFANVARPGSALRYSPTYHPGVASTAEATAVIIPASGKAPEIEFRLKLVPPARVSGRVSAHDGRELLSAAILMTAIDGRGAASEAPADPSLAPDGRFSFGHVAPGRYQIRARAETVPGRPLFALASIDVQGSDMDGIQMTLQPGARIEGTLVVDGRNGARPPPFSALRVRVPSIDGTSFGDATGTVQPDGSFALRGVAAGPRQIAVDGLPAPWTLKQVVYRGADVTDRIVEVGAKEQTHGVRVTITDVTTVVAGVVEDLRRRPVANAGVLIFSRTPLHWIRTNRHMRAAYTDPDGRFTISGLPAGQYVAIATMDADESDLGRRDRLRRLEPLGTPLQLDAADTRATLTLTLRGDR